jgi:two-component system cell cycle response regulator PopA
MSGLSPTQFDSVKSATDGLAQPPLTESENLFRAPRVMIVTDGLPHITALETHLGRLGYKTQICLFDGVKLSATPKKSPAAIIIHLTEYESKAEGISRILKQHYAPHLIPVLGVMRQSDPLKKSVFDSLIVSPAHASQIANRVNSFIRLSAMETEIALRFETLEKDFGQPVKLEDTGSSTPFRVLFIGKASAAFMVVINALQTKNVEVVAAFTSFSAFDYLHDSDFDAVVMNALEQAEPALSISETMRRNARLYHVPTLFLIDEPEFEFADKAYESGARDLIDIHSDANEISGRIIELANYHRLHTELKSGFDNLGGEYCLSETSHCYNRDFIDRHAERVVKNCHKSHKPVSFLTLKLLPNCVEKPHLPFIMAAIADIGKMLRNLVRMQDTVAHYNEDTYLLLFPDTNAHEAQIILDRLKALVDCTAYNSGNPGAALTMSLEASISEVERHESSMLAIGRAFSSLKNTPLQHSTSVPA